MTVGELVKVAQALPGRSIQADGEDWRIPSAAGEPSRIQWDLHWIAAMVRVKPLVNQVIEDNYPVLT